MTRWARQKSSPLLSGGKSVGKCASEKCCSQQSGNKDELLTGKKGGRRMERSDGRDGRTLVQHHLGAAWLTACEQVQWVIQGLQQISPLQSYSGGICSAPLIHINFLHLKNVTWDNQKSVIHFTSPALHTQYYVSSAPAVQFSAERIHPWFENASAEIMSGASCCCSRTSCRGAAQIFNQGRFHQTSHTPDWLTAEHIYSSEYMWITSSPLSLSPGSWTRTLLM